MAVDGSTYGVAAPQLSPYLIGGAGGTRALGQAISFNQQQISQAQTTTTSRTSSLSAQSAVGSALSSSQTSATTGTGSKLSAADQALIDKLKARDTEVRAHELAHERTAGQYAGAPSYTFQKGPDGTNYAIGGEVQIDTSSVSDDPAATIAKMQLVQRAALAPASPSTQDDHVAAEAAIAISRARSDSLKSSESAANADSATTPAKGAQANSAFVAQQYGSSQGSASAVQVNQLTRGLAAYSAAAGVSGFGRAQAVAVA